MVMSFEPVARMPIVRQLSWIWTPGPSRGTGRWRTVAPATGSSYTAVVTSNWPEGEPLAKILRAFTRKPPSTFSAFPDPSSQSEPPLETRINSSALTRLSNDSAAVLAAGIPCFHCHTVVASRWVCIESARAEEPQQRPISCSIAHSSGWVAPPPPNGAGTPAEKSLRVLKSA